MKSVDVTAELSNTQNIYLKSGYWFFDTCLEVEALHLC